MELLDHVSVGPLGVCRLTADSKPQGTSSALSPPPKHRKSRIKCGTGFLLTFSFNGDRITPFPASGSPSAYVGLPPTREPQGTSSALSPPPNHKKSRIKCGTERYNKAFSLLSDRITPFPTQARDPRRISSDCMQPSGTRTLQVPRILSLPKAP